MDGDNKVRVDTAGLQWLGIGGTKISHDGKFEGIPEPQDYVVIPVNPGDTISFPKGCRFTWHEID